LADNVLSQQLNTDQLNVVASWWFFHHGCITFAWSSIFIVCYTVDPDFCRH